MKNFILQLENDSWAVETSLIFNIKKSLSKKLLIRVFISTIKRARCMVYFWQNFKMNSV